MPLTAFYREGRLVARGEEVEQLARRGFGSLRDGELLLEPWEALYLVEKGRLEVLDSETGRNLDFQALLRRLGAVDKRTWPLFLIYRDLRERGYVVRSGFGPELVFRLYDRGDYGRKPARFVIYSMLEGVPVPVSELERALEMAQSYRKNLILAVVDRRGEVYVLDAVAQFIQRYGPTGELHGAIGGDLGFYRPRGLTIDDQGNLYVADTGNNRIVKLSPAGQLLAQFGGQGSGPGQLDQPTDVAVDAAGRMYVADTYNLRVQVLDPGGRHLRQWPISGANTFDSPHLALGPGGQVFITDPEAHLVIAYDGAGRSLGQWGGFGVAAGQFHKPISLAFDGAGRVYVTDAYNHRVQVFELGSPE